MKIRFTLGDARQIQDRYSCYLLGVLVGELDEHLSDLWRRAAARDYHEMRTQALHASNAARDIASRYGSAGGHPAPDVSGPAHRIYDIVSAVYEQHREHRPDGLLTDAEVQEIRKAMKKAGRLAEEMGAAANDACGA